MDSVIFLSGFAVGFMTCVVMMIVVWAVDDRRIKARIEEVANRERPIIRKLDGDPDPSYLAESDLAVDPAEYFGPTPDELRRLVVERPNEGDVA